MLPSRSARCAIANLKQADFASDKEPGRPLTGGEPWRNASENSDATTSGTCFQKGCCVAGIGTISRGLMPVYHVSHGCLQIPPPSAKDAVPGFLDAICTKKWLGFQFNQAPTGPLAAGLRELALHQAPEILRRFHDASLGFRLKQSLGSSPQLFRRSVILPYS